MVRKIPLQFVWLVALIGNGGCLQETSPMEECVDVEWQSAGFRLEDVYSYMEENFAIKREEIAVGLPCLQGEDALVLIQGRGDTVPKHQVWLAISRRGKLEIAPSE